MSRSIISNGFEYREQHSDGMSDEKRDARCIRRYNDEDPDDELDPFVYVSSQDHVSIFFVHFTLTILGHTWNNLCLHGFDKNLYVIFFKNLYVIFFFDLRKTNFQPTP